MPDPDVVSEVKRSLSPRFFKLLLMSMSWRRLARDVYVLQIFLKSRRRNENSERKEMKAESRDSVQAKRGLESK
jgi:hypothetical protein